MKARSICAALVLLCLGSFSATDQSSAQDKEIKLPALTWKLVEGPEELIVAKQHSCSHASAHLRSSSDLP